MHRLYAKPCNMGYWHAYFCTCSAIILLLYSIAYIGVLSSEGIEVLEKGKKLVEIKRKAKHCTIIVELVVCGSFTFGRVESIFIYILWSVTQVKFRTNVTKTNMLFTFFERIKVQTTHGDRRWAEEIYSFILKTEPFFPETHPRTQKFSL